MPQRYLVVAVTAVAALWMCIDRVCFSTLVEPIKRELILPHAPEPDPGDTLSADEITTAVRRKHGANPPVDAELTDADRADARKRRWADRRMADALSAFYLTYALFQIPMGRLADRFGARAVLALSIAAWSAATMLTGFVGGFAVLIGLRLLLGVTEAGAYPAAAGLVKRWAGPEERGRLSSVVTFGGRVGVAAAPWLTVALAAALGGVAVTEWAVTPAAVQLDPGEKPTNWRGVFVAYGLCGLAVAALFWLVVRDRPPGEPGASATGVLGEDLSNPPVADAPGSPAHQAPLVAYVGALARSRNMWLYGGVQLGVNLGWAFLVTLLPTYLKETFGTPLSEAGRMQSAALAIGCVGMICGGVVTDFMRRRLGPRYGRSVPIAAALGGCAVAFLLVPQLPNAWAVVVALGMMAFLVDLHNPALWAFAQDVGGRNVGAALGWGNMWGNLGAAVSSRVLVELRYAASWNVAFVCLAGVFAVAVVCGLLLDASKPVEEPS